MNFNSAAFLVFLPVVVTLYWSLPHRCRKYWLLAASYFFYMYANPALVLLLLASTAVDYCCGRGIEQFRNRRAVARVLLLISICVNLGLLFTFKYFDFFAASINGLCGTLNLPYRVPELGLILPVGISFYTFQTMSYTIDVYRGDFHAECDLAVFALYVTYFPQLVAGPIENPQNLLPQLKAEQKLNWNDFTGGVRLLLCGFFRKCVVADFCGLYVNAAFSAMSEANSLTILLAGSLFCIQMYCDFAGYSEIAAGAARLMGVRLMRNFDRPYLSQSYAEFFRRWHISLNRWFTSYVYIPLGGGRHGLPQKLFNTLVVFTLCGLWHGARWTYVLWGLYAAFWVCLESIVLKPAENAARTHGIDLDAPLVKLIRRSYMFLIFIPAALLFRAESVEQLGVIFARLLTQWQLGSGYLQAVIDGFGLDMLSLVQLILCIVTMVKLYSWSQYDFPPARTASQSAARMCTCVYMTVLVGLCWLALLQTQDMTGFAYFQF